MAQKAAVVALSLDGEELKDAERATKKDLRKLRTDMDGQFNIVKKLIHQAEEARKHDQRKAKEYVESLWGERTAILQRAEVEKEKAHQEATELRRELGTIQHKLDEIKDNWENLIRHIREGGAPSIFSPTPSTTSPTPHIPLHTTHSRLGQPKHPIQTNIFHTLPSTGNP